MPEGDTIYRIAVRLRPVLVGHRLTEAVTAGFGGDAPSLAGQHVSAIEARGKHLLIRIDNRLTIHTHLGMTGSWHIYATQESWRKPEHRATVVLATDAGAVAVCFSPKTCELLTDTALRRHRWLSQLGLDILADDLLTDINLLRLLENFRQQDQRPLGVGGLDGSGRRNSPASEL